MLTAICPSALGSAHSHRRRRPAWRGMRLAVGFAALLTFALAASNKSAAVSVSGILLYAADSFGTPNGYATYDACANIEAQLWRTVAAGRWHSLAVYVGLPPESLSGPPLNGRNFWVEIPLNEGENAFTLVGEPGPLTATDEYERFAINLYFNGNTEAVPGLSGLFERYAAPMGGSLSSNRSHCIYSLALNEMQGKPDLVYDDGIERVTVTGASFLPQDRFDPDWKFDLVGPQRFGPSGARDWIGVLRLFVEPSVSAVDAGAAPRVVVPAQPRSAGFSGSGAAGPGGPAPAVPGFAIEAPSQSEAAFAGRGGPVQPIPLATPPSPPLARSDGAPEEGDDEASLSSETPSLPPGTAPARTPSPSAPSRSSSPAATPSPQGTASGKVTVPASAEGRGTPSPQITGSPASSPSPMKPKSLDATDVPRHPTPTPRRVTH